MPELSEAKQVLLRALDEIEKVEEEMDAEVWALCVVYSVVKQEEGQTHENGGWSATGEPAWATAAMLRRAADDVEESTLAADYED